MRINSAYFAAGSALIATGLTLFWGCSTMEIRPLPPPVIQPPAYIEVPQPAGFDVSDISALFIDKRAPSGEVVAKCDADYRKLQSLTQSEEELRQGLGELVKFDPVGYHWCFYGKILELERALKTTEYVDERQKKVLEIYGFLVPLAKGFMRQYNDSRYLRWAIRHYRGLSEWVFFKKLDQGPRMTAELVEVANPFGLWREPASSKSVLEKYHLVPEQKDPQAEASPAPGKLAFPPVAEEGDEAAPAPASASVPTAVSADSSKLDRFPAMDGELGPAEGLNPAEAPVKPVSDLSK